MVPQRRWVHYPLIALAWAACALPNLGGPSLWDIDEGNNAEASREMLLSGDWVVPYFNFQLREDKPALLYWCQLAAYRAFGVNEFAARFPSAVALLLIALAAYELGRAMFSAGAGLLAGVALPTCWLLAAAGHFANPDALLTLSLTSAFAWFWAWYRGHPWAALPMGLSIGVGVLAKGPVALVMPVAVWTAFMLWQRRYWRLWRPSFVLGFSSWALVALPWYVWVTLDTRGHWLYGFWFRHNQGRFLNAMETHGGPVVYYLPVLLIGLAPWSLFLIHAVIDAIHKVRSQKSEVRSEETDEAVRRRDALRYLLVWAGVYVGFFSLAATKLPNYVLPVYPALALLVADRLERWRTGEALPGWVMPTALVGLAASAVGLLVGPLVAGRFYPGVEWLAVLGVLPLVGVGVFLWRLRRGDATGFLVAFALGGALTTALIMAWAATALEPHKAVRSLAEALPDDHHRRDVRVVTHDYFQPSLVFYTRRLVEPQPTLDAVAEALRGPQPVYALLPRRRWDELQTLRPGLGREVASRRDLYKRSEIVLVTNEPSAALASRGR